MILEWKLSKHGQEIVNWSMVKQEALVCKNVLRKEITVLK